jgi:hypothetical protein
MPESFEKRKQRVQREAREGGIVDAFVDSVVEGNGISLETVELATEFMRKNGPEIYERLKAAWCLST